MKYVLQMVNAVISSNFGKVQQLLALNPSVESVNRIVDVDLGVIGHGLGVALGYCLADFSNASKSIARALLEAKADPNFRRGKRTHIVEACKHVKLDVITLLLEHKADPSPWDLIALNKITPRRLATSPCLRLVVHSYRVLTSLHVCVGILTHSFNLHRKG